MRAVGILLVLALSSTLAQAHPGRTANDGCHYCRTSCSSWGVPKNQRHCHYRAEPQKLEEGLLKVGFKTTLGRSVRNSDVKERRYKHFEEQPTEGAQHSH